MMIVKKKNFARVESKAEMVELMDKIPGSFKSILNAEVSEKYSLY